MPSVAEGPRVAMLVPSVSRHGGGLFTAVAGLSTALLAHETQISVMSARDEATDLDRSSWGAVPVETLETVGPRSFCLQPGLPRALQRLDPDIVHLHGIWTYHSYASLGASKFGKLIVSPHGMLDPWALANSRFKKRVIETLYERRMIASAACLHALCGPERNAIRDFGYRGPIAVIPNGVDLPDASRTRPVPGWKRGLPDGAKVILFLGRIHPKKGLDQLIEALAMAQGTIDASWHLVVAGWDQNGTQAKLEALAHASGVAGRVHFIGPQFGDAKDATLAAADGFILPSVSEGLPMAILEAWSFGLPVLMTEACNLDIGFRTRSAVEISTRAADMSAQLGEFFSLTDAARRSIGANGLKLVQERYTWPQIAGQMRQTYDWLLGRDEAPSCVEPGASPACS